MLARERLSAPLWSPPSVLPWPSTSAIGRAVQIVATAATAGLLVMAALPDDYDNSSATTGNPPVSTARQPGQETDIGAYLGAPHHYPSDFHLLKKGSTDLTIKNVEWFTEPFQNPLYYGARVQRWFGGRFGSMIDFTHSKAYAPFKQDYEFQGTIDGKPAPATGKVGDYFSKLEWTHGHNMLTLNGLMRLPSIGIVSPYFGGGPGMSFPHSEIQLKGDASRTYEYQYTGPVGQVLFGLEFRLKSGSVFLEYKFTLADYWGPLTGRDGTWFPIDMWRQFSRWWKGEEPRDGWAGARLTSHQVIGGFLTRFVPKPAAP
jgi:lipid A oxidase